MEKLLVAKTKIEAIRKSIETSKPIRVGLVHIHILNQGRCVNSKWVASWIATKKQEHCECGYKCKISVIITRGNDYKYEYVLDKSELYRIINPHN